MATYSTDLRERVLAAYDRGEGSIRELAQFFAMSPNTIENWLRLRRETGAVAPRPHGGGVAPRIPDSELGQVRAVVARQNDVSTADLAATFARTRQIRVSRATFGRAIARAGITRKKKRPARHGA